MSYEIIDEATDLTPDDYQRMVEYAKDKAMTGPEQGERRWQWQENHNEGSRFFYRQLDDKNHELMLPIDAAAYLNTLEATAARVEGLEQALRRYGRHDAGCPARDSTEIRPPEGGCTCGFRVAHQGTAEDGKDG